MFKSLHHRRTAYAVSSSNNINLELKSHHNTLEVLTLFQNHPQLK
ncbi:Uncharacterised protein [Vibrio cholerae]|nr:Uncharacterised protein [Vibrio cholerae]